MMKTRNKGIIIPDFLLAIKWLSDGGKCMMDLHQELDISYKHLHQLKVTFAEFGWVTVHKEGMRHNMFLTEKGRVVLEAVNNLLDVMGYTEHDIKQFIKDSKYKKTGKDNNSEVEKEGGFGVEDSE